MCESRVKDISIKLAQKYNNFGIVVTDDKKWETEFWGHIGLAKEAFQRLSQVLRHMKMSLETKEKVSELLCHI